MPAPGGEHPVQLLRRLAAWERQLPPAPWRPVERSDLAHRGPAEFDPDVDLDRAAFDRAEQVRSQTAAWRGLVDADGNELVGQSLPGGTPQTVNDPVWRFLAELRNALPELLTFTRQLWRQAASRHRSDRPGALQPPARCAMAPTPTRRWWYAQRRRPTRCTARRCRGRRCRTPPATSGATGPGRRCVPPVAARCSSVAGSSAGERRVLVAMVAVA